MTQTLPARPGAAEAARGTRGFRADIQVLRALAVLSVLLYHLWPNRLTGGFVGVDVFFVISGFLITSHLLRERASTGRISLARFWARRAARLLPASLLVLAVTAIGVILWVPRSLWQQFLGEIVASTLYVQNWRLMQDSVDYLAADNQPSPVQHFWTLSAEEQFYVMLPLLLVAAMFALRRLGWRRAALLAVAAATAASFAYSAWLMTWSPSEAYFSTFTRAWEFGAGALLAFAPALVRGRGRDAIALGGIALIAASMVLYTGQTPFPGPTALLPVVGTVLVIWAGRESVLERVGALAPIAFLGRVSYAVYLWHWPLIVLVPFLTDTPLTTLHKAAIAVGSCALAWASTRFVEDPVRTSRRLLAGRRPRIVALWSVVGMVCALIAPAAATAALRIDEQRVDAATARLVEENPPCFGAQSMDPELAPCENPDLAAQPLVPSLADIRSDDDNKDRDDCWSKMLDPEFRVCSLGPDSGWDKHVIAVGDSHNNTLIGAYERVAETLNWRIDVAGHEGCYWTAEELEQSTPEGTAACTAWREEMTRHAASAEDLDAIIVTRFAGHHDEDDAGAAAMAEAWAQRADPRIPIVAIIDNPHLSGSVISCVEQDPGTAVERCAVPRDRALVDDGQRRAAQLDPRARVVDMTDLYCDETMCPPVIGGVVVYRDGTHLTGTYARTLAPYLAERLRAAVG